MNTFLMALAAAIGVLGIGGLSALVVVTLVRLMERKRKPPLDDNQLAVYGDGAWPKTTDLYRTGVHVRHPEPADQVPDDDPTTDPKWPGKAKQRGLL